MLNPTPPKEEAPQSPSKQDAAAAGTTGTAVLPVPTKKKFQNGWTREVELLLADWADKAVCYRWMHETTERIYHRKDLAFMFPVIILSTLTGAANFAMDSVLSGDQEKKYAQIGLGGLSIMTGIISTIANRLAYASGSEAHKGAALLWGKFQRLIAIELRLHPNERSDCMHFLKMCRSELDRLIEQSPTIPSDVIESCRKEFSKFPKVRRPEIVGDIDTTQIFEDKGERVKKLAQEAALSIAQKKGVLKQMVLDDLEPRISRVLEYSSLPEIREEMRKELQRAAEKATREAVAAVAAGRVTAASATATYGAGGTGGVVAGASTERAAVERRKEVEKIAMSGLVSSMREKLASSNSKVGEAPVGVGSLFAELGSANRNNEEGTPEIILHVGAEAALPSVGLSDEEAAAAVADPYRKL
jgi:hypothetical protein